MSVLETRNLSLAGTSESSAGDLASTLRTGIKTLAFTGPRPQNLGGFSDNNPVATLVRERLQTMVPRAIDNGFTRFISGMALGVDTWAAEAVLKLHVSSSGIILVSAVPFTGQCNPWPAQARTRWLGTLKEADQIYLASEGRFVLYPEFYKLFRTTPLEPLPGHIASRLLQRRNEWMVDQCDTLFAVWDGKEGGTGKTVDEYALAQGKRVVQFHTVTRQTTRYGAQVVK